MFIFKNNCSKIDTGWNSKNSKSFLWNSSKPKVNYKTLWNGFQEGSLKNVDIKEKVIRLQYSWVKKLFDGTHHNWRIIPLFLINKYFGKSFHYHLNLPFNLSLIDSFPEFYKQILINWSTCFVSNSEVPSSNQLNFLWYNKHLLIDNRPVYLQSFADKDFDFLDNLLDGSGIFKSWNEIKAEFNLADNLYFSWLQLINSIPLNWQNTITNNCSSTNLLLPKHHLVKKNNLISIDKLYFQELYNMLTWSPRRQLPVQS